MTFSFSCLLRLSRRNRGRGLLFCALWSSLPAPTALWSKEKAAENSTHSFQFRYLTAEPEKSLNNFVTFMKKTVPGRDGVLSAYAVADLHMRQGRYGEASNLLRQLGNQPLEDDPFFNASVWQKLADCLMRLENYSQAAELYQKARDSGVKNLDPEATLGLAISAMMLDQEEAAYKHYQDLITRYPAYKNDPELFVPLGLICWLTDRFEEALTYFLRDAKNPAALFFAGLSHRSLHKNPEALGMFRKVTRGYPRSAWAPWALLELGETFYQQKDLTLAYQTFLELANSKAEALLDHLAIFRLACIDFQRKNFKAAEEKLQFLYKKEEILADRVLYLLTETLTRQKKVDDAAYLLERQNKGQALSPEYAYRLMWAYAELGRYPEAISLSSRYIKDQKDEDLTPRMLLIQSYVYEKSGRTSEALASLQLVADNFPQMIYAAKAATLASVYNYKAQHFKPIVAQVNSQWQSIDPEIRKKHPDTLFWIAKAHVQLKNHDTALNLFRQFLRMAKTSHPLAIPALRGQAEAAMESGDFDAAQDALQEAVEIAKERKDNARLAFLTVDQANLAYNQKNYESAASLYLQAQKMDPKSAQAPFALYQAGVALRRTEYYTDAILTWDKLVKEYPRDENSPRALFQASKIRFDMGKYPEAVAGYEKLARTYPKSDLVEDAKLQVGQSYYNAGNFLKAAAVYQDYLKQYPDSDQAAVIGQMLQTAYYQAKKSPAEIESLTKSQPKSEVLGDIYWEEAAKLYNEKKYDEAQKNFQKILYEFPSSPLAPQAAFYRGECLFLLERYEPAVGAYDTYLKSYPEDPQRSVAMFHWAVSLFNMKEFVKSAEAFEEFAESFPDDPLAANARMNAALSYVKSEEMESAAQAFRRYAELYPNSEDIGSVYLQLGQALEKAGNLQEAVAALQRMPANRPEYGEASFNAGRIYRKLKDPAGEKQAYEKLKTMGVKNDAYRISGLLRLAEIYLSESEVEKAKSLYVDVAQNASDPASANLAQQQIQALQQSPATP